MERSQIKKEILNMLIERNARISPEEMSDNIDIRNDIDLDSIQILEIIGDIEDRFDIEIPDRKLRELKTVGNIITFIEENQ